MVLEVTLIDVLPGREDEFVSAYQLARPVIAGATGCRSVRINRGIKEPSRFVLLVEWDSMEAVEHNFRRTERFAQWRAAIGGALAQPPVVEHFDEVPVGRHTDADTDFFAA